LGEGEDGRGEPGWAGGFFGGLGGEVALGDL